MISASLKKALTILRTARRDDPACGIIAVALKPNGDGVDMELYIDRVHDHVAAVVADRIMAKIAAQLATGPTDTEVRARIRALEAARRALGVSDKWAPLDGAPSPTAH